MIANSACSSNFSFKCHRETPTGVSNITNVFCLNAISFHPTYGTFSTAGSDGTFHFWYDSCLSRLTTLANSISGIRTPSTALRATLRSAAQSPLPTSTATAQSLPMLCPTTGARDTRQTTRSIPTRSCSILSKRTRRSLDNRLPKSDRRDEIILELLGFYIGVCNFSFFNMIPAQTSADLLVDTVNLGVKIDTCI